MNTHKDKGVKKINVVQAVAEMLSKNRELIELLDKKVGIYGGYWLRSDLVKEKGKYLLKIWTEFDENRYVTVDEDFPNDL